MNRFLHAPAQNLTLHRRAITALWIGLTALLAAGGPVRSAQAQAEARILDRYVQTALAQNLALHQEELDLAASLQALNEARGLFYPSLRLEARYTRAGGGRTIDFPVGDLLNPVYGTLNDLLADPVFPTIQNEEIAFLRPREQATRLLVSQPLYRPDLRHQVRIRRHQAASQEAAVEAFRRRLTRDVKVAYYQYLQAEQAVDVYRAARTLVDENERVNDRLFHAHQVTEDAVFRARTEAMAVDQQLANAEKDRDVARSYFNFLLNRPLDADVERVDLEAVVRRDLDHTALLPAGGTPVETLQHQALARREELGQLDEAVAAARSGVDLARSAYLPNVSLVLDTGLQGEAYGLTDEQTYYAASVVLQWSLFEGFQKRARLRQQQLAHRTLQVRRDELAQQIRLEVEDAYRTAGVAARRALRTAEERVGAARKNFRIVSRKYDEGLAAHVAFIDARTALTQAELNLNVTRADLLVRLAELEYAVALDPAAGSLAAVPRDTSRNAPR